MALLLTERSLGIRQDQLTRRKVQAEYDKRRRKEKEKEAKNREE